MEDQIQAVDSRQNIEEFEKFEELEKSIKNGKVNDAEKILSKIFEIQKSFNLKIKNLDEEGMKIYQNVAIERNEVIEKNEQIFDVHNEAIWALMELGVDESEAKMFADGVKSVKEAKERYKQSFMN